MTPSAYAEHQARYILTELRDDLRADWQQWLTDRGLSPRTHSASQSAPIDMLYIVAIGTPDEIASHAFLQLQQELRTGSPPREAIQRYRRASRSQSADIAETHARIVEAIAGRRTTPSTECSFDAVEFLDGILVIVEVLQHRY